MIRVNESVADKDAENFVSTPQYHRLIALIVFLSIIGLLACANKYPNGRQIVIETAPGLEASTFREKCAICHGIEALGKVIGGKQIPSLRDGEALKKTEEEIFNQIYKGGNGMLPFKDQLSEEKIRKMARFVKHDVQGKD